LSTPPTRSLPAPRKRFGQNFLQDPASIAHILSAIAATPEQHLVEIGPGRGAITLGLLRATGCLDAIELDWDLVEPLTARCAGRGELRVHQADALQFDFCSLAGNGALRVVGNLPYNISTPLLFHLLDQAVCIQDMHFLLQKEVVERLAASPGSKIYGRLSVMVQARCEVQPLFDIAPESFHPVPKVDSTLVRLLPHRQVIHAIADPIAFSRLVAQAFSQRRKTLRNTLRPLLDESVIRAQGLDPNLRPEQLSVAAFVRLANVLVACDTN
jgi:16S rRNA (adenine1518-N6/adenine1519-N6)-dimethyltransferase